VKRKFLLLLTLPLLTMLLSFYMFSLLSRDKVREEFQRLTLAEGQTIRQLLDITASRQLDGGGEGLIPFVEALYTNDSIVYIGLFRQETLIHLLSRYEGYFPVSPSPEDFRIIDSPLGRILDIRSRFADSAGQPYRLHIGFDYAFLDRQEEAANRKFLFLLAIFAFISLFVFSLVLYFERRMFQGRLAFEKADQERERFRELSILTAEIAHEIKNPLNAVYLAFNALEPQLAGSEEARFYRDAIRREIRRVNDIILSYSDLARDITPQALETNIPELLLQTKWLADQELGPLGIDLRVETEPALRFHTDGALLSQVLLNLIKNAQEAGARTIRIEASRQENRLVLRVSDDGSGIPPEKSAEIFKPYTSGKAKGMGLGLHIVRRILRVQNGRIDLVSSKPGATCFRIEIPEKPHE
jgi:signal transduction histidine kinase